MKKPIIGSIILAVVLILANCNLKNENKKTESKISDHIININKIFSTQIDTLITDISSNPKSTNYTLQFDRLRNTFKQIEWAVAFFTPTSYRFINGPNLDEIEFEENAILEAEGLQTLEEYFYPVYNIENSKEVIRYLKKLKNKSQSIDIYFSSNQITIPQVIESIRNQVFRIITLGITGFDTPVSGNGLTEVKYSLMGIQQVFDILSNEGKAQKEIQNIKKTINDINNKTSITVNKNDFDYLDLITQDLNRLSKNIFDYCKAQNIQYLNISAALKPTSITLFDKNGWDTDFFAPSKKYYTTPEKIKLGEALFKDNMLSGNGTRSCQSCHNPTLAFSDGLKSPNTLNGDALKRNSPSLTYANFQHGQFWDMRREDLESQSSDVITNKDEMHGSLAVISSKLNTSSNYKNIFQEIYKTQNVEPWQLQNALATYIRSLSTFTSNFDRYMQGDNEAMTKEQKEGFNLFVGKGKCATCHFIPLFNGTVPPDYLKTESEVLGTGINSSNLQISPDKGRGTFYTTIPHAQHSFKTPSLRNIAITAPYMHNGGYNTLEEVMEFYNEGGGNGFGFEIEYQTLPSDKLELTPQEIKKVILFLNALTDKQYL